MAKQGYVPKDQRKKILLLSDDIRMQSGIATMAREIVVGTSHHYNWVNVGAGINHPEHGKRLDLSHDTNKHNDIEDSSVIMYPNNGYGDPDLIRQLIAAEKPDAIMFFTDPRYWIWLFQMENEIRKKIPMIYLNIWDDLPAPLYNESFYESCDGIMAISKQTLNINKIVLGDKQKGKVLKYVPHGINEKHFFPITKANTELFESLQAFKKQIFGEKEYDYVVLYNARNIRRKSTSDLILAYAQFCEKIGKEKAKRCVLLLHTQPVDENGTDLIAVQDLLCDPEYCNIVYTNRVLGVPEMNMLYNLADVTALISSNEGWGLSLTESMICGKMIIANVTGGMQDQMRFEFENGSWIDFNKDFCSNHFGTVKAHGKWAMPVYPSNMSVVGSIQTPYIFDDRADFRDVTKAIEDVYNLTREERAARGALGREWVLSDESMMTAANMCKNAITAIDDTLISFVPKPKFELIKTVPQPRRAVRHKLVY
jgi:glycosyltransferase involved in cell wall biosynthesis